MANERKIEKLFDDPFDFEEEEENVPPNEKRYCECCEEPNDGSVVYNLTFMMNLCNDCTDFMETRW